MQTFLPYSDFLESAKSLDKKRCWKQVVEAKQIIDVLCKISDASQQCSDDEEFQQFLKTISWRNHPAVKMWENHILSLMYYFNVFLNVCKRYHGINTKYETYRFDGINEISEPWWLGNEDFHRAMRARLIEKNPAFYSPKFPEDKGFNGGKYLWPDNETKTFRII